MRVAQGRLVGWAVGREPALEDLTHLLSDRALDLDGVLTRIMDEIAGLVGADRGTLYLLDRTRGELVSHVAHLDEIAEIRLALGEGVAGHVARTGERVRVRCPGEQWCGRIDAQTGYQTGSVLAGPLWDEDGAVLGVVQLLNKPGGFSGEDEARLDGLGRRIGALLIASSLGAQLRPSSPRPLSWRFNHIVGDSEAMREVYTRTARAARSTATVLVRGESGSGKELIARAVHDNSPRHDGPFVVVDLAALPEALANSALFGHRRGAYTGAHDDADGRVLAAHGGTLFLDELGDASPSVQLRLLRLLEERSFFPVGSSEPRTVDVRFVFATHRNLEALVEAGRFREDLYWRLRVVEIAVPPLRDRGAADLDRLMDHFLHQLCRTHGRGSVTLSQEARRALHAHRWPGNVRELRHVLESAVVLSEGPILAPDALGLRPREPQHAADFHTGMGPLERVERDYVAWVLDQCAGNRSEAARVLGISRNTLARKIQSP